MTATVVPEPHVEAAVQAVAARCLRSSVRFDPDTPFALLGIDSLATIEMAAALEDSLGCALPPDLVAECPDARSLAVRITQLRSDRPAINDRFEQMLADAVLPDDVIPRGAARCSDLHAAKRILLTGATGFLGGALLKELLRTTDAEVVCLVRGRAPDHRRVRLLHGDLSHQRLGLSARQFDELAGHVDAIVHCGAAVNWVYGYSSLRAANVLGTLELLRLACAGGIPFHFISSLSVCYTTDGPHATGESFDALPHLRRVELGYAQTKTVAEALVREAAQRGLPARIYRPPLISGDTRTGAYNRDDLITALVRGCVRMGAAPDLDWRLDCQPVDFVARAILQLAGEAGPVFHLGHRHPRHWRECVLWMRMYGYDVRLATYHAWLRQLDRETRPNADGAASHPLRPLRSFFLDRRPGSGLTLPELYDEVHRTHADSSATRALLERTATREPALDADLLQTYFSAFRVAGDLPAPAPPPRRSSTERLRLDAEFFSRLLERTVRDVRILGSGSEHSIVSELSAWRSGRVCGLFHARVELDDGSALDLRLKAKAADADVIEVGEALAATVDPNLGEVYCRWSPRIGFAKSHHREIEIYRQRDPRFVRHAPALLGSALDDERGLWLLALENIADPIVMNAADDPSVWTRPRIACAIDGLAALQSIWLGRESELRRQPWIGYVQSTDGMQEMDDLWRGLARQAAPCFSSWAGPDIVAIQQDLIDSIECWWPAMENGPRTLIHNDFNPRNVCLRGDAEHPAPCAYDWELATIGAPQRDLAEFLSFVLPSDLSSADFRGWVDYHREALVRATGDPLCDPACWWRGFRGGLHDFLINRLSIYAVVHRVRRQPFLPRVVRTWRRLYDLTLEESM
jgi:thioester reductase-like protein